MAVTFTFASGFPSLLPPEFNTIGRTTSTVDMSLFPTSPNDLVSRLSSLIPSALVTVTTIQTFQTVQTFQTTFVPSTVVQPVTVFITETATLQETVREVVEIPVATQLPDQPRPEDTPTPSEVPLAPPNDNLPITSPDDALATAPPEVLPPVAEPITASPQAGTELAVEAPVKDPAAAQFFGGVPTKTVDIPITAIFLVLFAIGAFLHISIYRRNAKRGHKFLLSDLMFDFCMIRVVTCIFRITWSIVSTRGVILIALITLNGG